VEVNHAAAETAMFDQLEIEVITELESSRFEEAAATADP